MGILSWILFGLCAGAVAKFLMPGRDPGGLIVTIALGVLGAIIGGWLGTLLGFGKVDAFDLRGLGTAVVGAMLVLAIHRLVRGRNDS